MNTKMQPPCAERPDQWDIDVGGPEAWQRAVAVCNDCPLLPQCQALANELQNRGIGPRAMIWAGVGYDGSGRVIRNLNIYRHGRGRNPLPLTIRRTGRVETEFPDESDAGGSSARRIVIHLTNRAPRRRRRRSHPPA
ncbi:MAG: hypothetical protein HOQ24_01270 [Mycobacteriaceae bacterium]|nr:hypothetical protein [Mycobacteriaceae bacterium]